CGKRFSTLIHHKLLALVALAVGAQIVPRINSSLMSIIPVEADRVLAHTPHLLRAQFLLVQGKNRGRLLDRLSRPPVRLLALFITGGTRTGIAQPLKGKVRNVSILPINVHSSASRSVHLDELWVSQRHSFSIA